ncbi:MAG: cation transporter [Lachnospiraceae bacterium]|nr:cation transporter [Ruminococcus sp.]MCM1273969.1 cation transporter [Lachnospiraceae bacterium]
MIKTTLKIDGMMCGMCEAHINDAVRAAFKVKKVSSSHKKGVTEIISETPLDENSVRECIEKTGYKLLSACSEEYVKKGLFGR